MKKIRTVNTASEAQALVAAAKLLGFEGTITIDTLSWDTNKRLVSHDTDECAFEYELDVSKLGYVWATLSCDEEPMGRVRIDSVDRWDVVVEIPEWD